MAPVFWLLASVSLSGLAADQPPGEAARPKPPEFVEMLVSIVTRGSEMGPTSGWFHPSRSRHGWDWLAKRFDRDQDGAVTTDEFKGSAPLFFFRALDRDGDGTVTAEDLDWSPRSRYLQARGAARGRFSRMDRNGNGRVTREEWNEVFDRGAKEKAYLTPNDIADLLFPAPPRSRPASSPSGSEGPTRLALLKGLFSGEIGSPFEGPGVGQEAPDFSLETHDKTRRIALSEYRWEKPVVLIFGSFT
ncbi:MAG: hypothetical protein NVSMB9_26230 [Isosphaeraceae bacterium]